MDDDRIDFSALYPERDPDRFERMVRAVVAGAMAAPAAHPLALEIARFGRAAVACAVLLAAATWVPTLTRAGVRDAATAGAAASRREDPVELVSAWAEKGSVPSDLDLLAALGGSDGR